MPDRKSILAALKKKCMCFMAFYLSNIGGKGSCQSSCNKSGSDFHERHKLHQTQDLKSPFFKVLVFNKKEQSKIMYFSYRQKFAGFLEGRS